MPRIEKWSLKYDCCVNCGGNDVKHIARGLCLNCYQRETEKRNRGVQRSGKGLASHKLIYKYLYEEYVNKERFLGDIAKDCNCGRQFVYSKIKEYDIPLRSKTDARILALQRGKVSFERMDENGNVREVTLQKNKLNEKFFKAWSNQMAYVLGVIYTDGNLRPGVFRAPNIPDTLRVGRFTVSQKEPELLHKILESMECNAKLLMRKRKVFEKGASGQLYYFHVNNDELYDDLIALGLSPNKSLDMKFPDIPPQYIRHFIRGCWDGDGSIFLDKGNLIASYISGSLNFVERLVQELYRVGIYRLGKKFERDEMWLEFPEGRFPLKIHTDKRVNAFYIKIQTRENIRTLFHYFYDGVDESMYLTRKYNVFVKG